MFGIALQDNTYLINYNGRNGTAFTMLDGNDQYLVTASHVVENIITNRTINIYGFDKWLPHRVEVVSDGFQNVPTRDITILKLTYTLSQARGKKNKKTQLGVTVSRRVNLPIGDQVYVLGFPYGLNLNAPNNNNGFPIPITKGGLISGTGNLSNSGNFNLDSLPFGNSNAAIVYYLDGQINSGFSGGPVIIKSQNTQSVIGVFALNLKALEEGASFRTDSGIGIFYPLKYAKEMIKEYKNSLNQHST